MPTAPPASLVLVTGASGFVAAWIVKTLLDEGYRVRGTVRSKSKGEYLKAKFENGFEYVIVEDMGKEGAFDEAVKGVDAVMHPASPVVVDAHDPEELIRPAVQGTLSVLEAVAAYGPNVKRVVITSSCATIWDPAKPCKNLNEDSWNLSSIEEVKAKGVDAEGRIKYRASKTLAEQAAWKFVEDRKVDMKFDIAVIHPPYVFGPIIHQVSSPETLNASVKWFYEVLMGSKSDDELVQAVSSWVDVRDVALAHVRAIEKQEAGGHRIITSTKASWSWQDLLNTLDPSKPIFRKGKTGVATTEGNDVPTFDSSKSVKLLGLEYRSIEECARDMANAFVERGWLS